MYGRDRLLEILRSRGFLRSPGVDRALQSVDLQAFLPEPLAPLAYANAPIPFAERFRGAVLPSPPMFAAFLQLLEVEPDHSVGMVGSGGGYPAAILGALAPRGSVTLAEPDGDLRGLAEKNLARAGVGAHVTVAPALEGRGFDRILVLEQGRKPTEFTAHLADLGFVVSRGLAAEGMAFRKRIRNGSEELELSVADMPAGPRGGGEAHATTWARILARDEAIEHAWEGRVLGPYEGHFAEAVDETFRDGPLDPDRNALDPRSLAARRAFHAAYVLQNTGELEDAADLYGRSIALRPSAEGHTFLGWVYSFSGDLERAIQECEEAIAADASFGNPYNDIGAYLIELERLDEAIPWLKKALEAERYCCAFYAHTNLGRVYLLQGLQQLARKHFQEALEANPGYEPAREMLRRADRKMDYFA